MLGQDDRQRERDALVVQIARAPRRSTERAALFSRLRAVLQDARSEASATLETLREEAADHMDRLRDSDCVLDRTWPFALHDDDALRELDGAVRSAVGLMA